MLPRRALRTLELALSPISFLTRQRFYQAPIYDQLSGPNCQKILFIGNSVTYYNDLPGLVAQFSAREGRPLRHARVILPNTSLAGHRDLPRADRLLSEGGWSYVVLQEYSSRPVRHPEDARRDIRHWAAEARRVGARPVLFESWPNRYQPAYFAKMQRFFAQAQQETGGLLAPVASAWQRCLQSHPEIRLYLDFIHPTVAGTYLAACVLYRALYQKPARELPTEIPGLKLPAQTAATLHAVADNA